MVIECGKVVMIECGMVVIIEKPYPYENWIGLYCVIKLQGKAHDLNSVTLPLSKAHDLNSVTLPRGKAHDLNSQSACPNRGCECKEFQVRWP